MEEQQLQQGVLLQKCLLCLSETGSNCCSWGLSSINRCFRDYSDISRILERALKEGTFCSQCDEKIKEIYLTEKRLERLIISLEQDVIHKYKLFKEQQFDTDGCRTDSLTVMNLRMKFHKLSTKLSRSASTKKLISTSTSKTPVETLGPLGLSDVTSPAPRRVRDELDGDSNVVIVLMEDAENVSVGEDGKPFESRIYKTRSSISRTNSLRCTFSGCGRKFFSESARFRHIRREHHEEKEKSYACHECDNTFTTYREFRKHCRSHKTGRESQKIYPCTVDNCSKIFVSDALRFVHIKKFHEGATSYSCGYCEKVFGKPSKLRIHERTHTGELPYECPDCKKRFSAKAYLQQHVRLHMNKFVCDICGKPNVSRHSLQTHINTHSAIKSFICEMCGYTCSSKQSLDIHQANLHEGSTQAEAIKCNACGKYLSSKTALDNHMTTIHKVGEAKFQCEFCNSGWNNRRELRIHTNSVHLNIKNYECIVCNKKYSTQSNLRMHHERHHTAKEARPRPFQCPSCPKRFFMKRTLENHIAIHSKDRPYSCDKCNHRFPTKSYLDLHKYTIHDKRKRKRELTLDSHSQCDPPRKGNELQIQKEPLLDSFECSQSELVLMEDVNEKEDHQSQTMLNTVYLNPDPQTPNFTFQPVFVIDDIPVVYGLPTTDT